LEFDRGGGEGDNQVLHSGGNVAVEIDGSSYEITRRVDVEDCALHNIPFSNCRMGSFMFCCDTNSCVTLSISDFAPCGRALSQAVDGEEATDIALFGKGEGGSIYAACGWPDSIDSGFTEFVEDEMEERLEFVADWDEPRHSE